MDLFVNHKGNKENNNPVLVPSQFEILSKEGVFNKTNTLLYPQNRFHYRKPRYSITQLTQQPIMGHSNSSQSMHKEIEKIEKIAKQLQSQQMHTMTQTNFSQTMKERQTTQHSQQSHTQVTEMMELLEKENLLRIQQIKPSTPRRAYTPQINYHLPPLLSENKSHCQESSEKVTPQLRSYQIFKRPHPSQGEFKKISQILENRQKRTTSQILQTQMPQKQQLPIKERINKVLQNSQKILSLCKRVPEIQEQMSEAEILELIQSDHFKIELQHLINNSVKGSNSQVEIVLQNFMIEQVKKQRELIEIENVLQEKKQNFCLMLNNYIQELKQKL